MVRSKVDAIPGMRALATVHDLSIGGAPPYMLPPGLCTFYLCCVCAGAWIGGQCFTGFGGNNWG